MTLVGISLMGFHILRQEYTFWLVVACSCSADGACSKNRCSCNSSNVSCTTYCKCAAGESCQNPNTEQSNSEGEVTDSDEDIVIDN